jgi:polysaccharide export outer membrane protein
MTRIEAILVATFAVASLCHGQSKPANTEMASTEISRPGLSRGAVPDDAVSPAEKTYVIGPSDTLTVMVWKESAISGSFLVRPDGMISLALLGDVHAEGLTPTELAGEIRTKLCKYIQDPSVTVRVDQIHSKTVYLLGEVMKKGPLEMTPGMTLLQAISSAGGLTEYANKKKIYILRNEAGKQAKLPVRYKDALKGDNSFNPILLPGDTIVVP